MSVNAESAKHQNIALFRRLIDEGFNQGEFAAIDEIVSPDQIEHQPGLGSGPNGLKGAITFLRTAFPDLILTIEDITANGDTVWARMKGRGTNTGSFAGRPATGNTIEIDIFDQCRFENGQMVEHWGVPDRFSQMQQLGFLPD